MLSERGARYAASHSARTSFRCAPLRVAFNSLLLPLVIFFPFRVKEAKMYVKTIVAASTTERRGAAAITGMERRPRRNYHNFIISSFQGSLPPVSKQQHLNARPTRYQPCFCASFSLSLSFSSFLFAYRLFLLERRRIRYSCTWEYA